MKKLHPLLFRQLSVLKTKPLRIKNFSIWQVLCSINSIATPQVKCVSVREAPRR